MVLLVTFSYFILTVIVLSSYLEPIIFLKMNEYSRWSDNYILNIII